MPDRLKSLLVDDWENITKNLQLVQLPSNHPAGVILDEYLQHAIDTGNRTAMERDILEEVILGLKGVYSCTALSANNSTTSGRAFNSRLTNLLASHFAISMAVNIFFAFWVSTR
jgi:hypothetical protein